MQHPWTTEKAVRARLAQEGVPLAQHQYNGAPTVNVEAFLGLTTWTRTTDQTPPSTGWWKTRRLSSLLLLQPQRRWWDGKRWSLPVLAVDSDEDAEYIAGVPCWVMPSDIEWCGLTSSYPGGYPYRLIKT